MLPLWRLTFFLFHLLMLYACVFVCCLYLPCHIKIELRDSPNSLHIQIYINIFIHVYIGWYFPGCFAVCCFFLTQRSLYHSLPIPTPPLTTSLFLSLTLLSLTACVYRSVYIYAAVQKSVQKIACVALLCVVVVVVFLVVLFFSLTKYTLQYNFLNFEFRFFVVFFLLFLSYEPKMFKYNNAEIYNFVVCILGTTFACCSCCVCCL